MLTKSFDIRSEGSRPKFSRLYTDRNGLIWAGTDKGIFTFDGLTFTKVPGTDSLSFGSVTAIYQDHKGMVWAGYENGKIIQILSEHLTVFSPQEGFPKVSISDFCEDKQGQLYISTKGEGVYVYSNKRFYNFDQNDGLTDNFCYGMAQLPDDRICVGTDEGVNIIRFSNGIKSQSSFTHKDGLPDDIVRTITVTNNGELWLGFQESGIAQFDYISSKVIFSFPQWQSGQVNKILPLNNELWIITEENGVFLLNDKHELSELKPEGYTIKKPGDIISDFENNIWISESIHLYRTSGSKITLWKNVNGQALNLIHCIYVDSKNNIWFCPDNFLSKVSYDARGNMQAQKYMFSNTQNPADVVTIYEDKYGYLWIGTLGEGVYRLNPATGKFRQITAKAKIEESSVLSITGEGDNIWIGGFNGVVKMTITANGNTDNAEISIDRKTSDGLSNDYVYTVFIDSKKRIWFGTDEHGAFFLDKDQLINIPMNASAVHSFTEDKKGRIWFTIPDAGIGCYNKDSLITLTTKDGLSDPSPSSIYCTSNGKLIVVHANGFDVINPDTRAIIYHSTEENLSDINPDLNCISESADSTVYIGTERGILIYHPYNDFHLSAPKLDLRNIYLFNETVDTTRHLFQYDENNFRFEFSGLWYGDPQRVNYSFMLDAYSGKWVQTKDHSVTYSKLAPGTYTFRIRSSLNSDFSNSEELTYQFTISPPYWQRWWFRIILVGLIVALIVYIVKRREHNIRKLDLLQKQNIEFQYETLKNQVNPHFLFNSFNTLISVIETTPELAIEYVEKLSEFFRSIVSYREKTLIPLEEEVNLVSKYIFIQKKRYGKSLEYICDIQQEQMKGQAIPPLTLQLLAENAIKHNAVSRETPLKIDLFISAGRIVMSNNINPKINKETSEGVGLQNIINRYKLLTREAVNIDINENRFIVSLPIIKDQDL
ncbi:MAG: two-component regulator propeller domain-containing protein [Bacteroidia bacterium]